MNVLTLRSLELRRHARGWRAGAAAGAFAVGCAAATPPQPAPSKNAFHASQGAAPPFDAAAEPTLPDANTAEVSVRPRGWPAWVPTSERDCPALEPCPAGMVRIPGGMGSYGWYICPLCLDRTEVTVAAYAACVSANQCAEPDPYDATDPMRSGRYMCNWKNPKGRSTHPINCLSVNEARNFCHWRSGRLPTYEEFFWSSAGGDEDRLHPWGNAPPDGTRVNACGLECAGEFDQNGWTHSLPPFQWRDRYPETAPVGSFPAGNGRWGNADLAGNVNEFVEDALSGEPGACGGGFLFEPGVEIFQAGACIRAQLLPGGRGGPDEGFRCARGGRAVLRTEVARELSSRVF
jgi:hypothetical protein